MLLMILIGLLLMVMPPFISIWVMIELATPVVDLGGFTSILHLFSHSSWVGSD